MSSFLARDIVAEIKHRRLTSATNPEFSLESVADVLESSAQLLLDEYATAKLESECRAAVWFTLAKALCGVVAAIETESIKVDK